MEFAGRDYVYLSKLKKEKIRKIRKAEEENKEGAPIPEIEPKDNNKMEIEKEVDQMQEKLNKFGMNNLNQKKGSVVSDDSDDAYLQVNSNDFNIDLVSNQMNIPKNQNAAPGLVFKKAIDTNICVIRYNSLEKNSEMILPQLYKCQHCQAYLNKYSKLVPTPKNDTYEWKCEFCFFNNQITIEKKNIPQNEIIENCIEPQIVKETKKDDDSTLIFCFDISGSMCQSYNVGPKLREKFNKIIGKKPPKRNLFSGYVNDDNEDFSNFDFNQNNTNYISRLDLVKLSVENNINSLLKNSPNTKVGIVSFGSEIEVKGDCLSNIMIVKEKDMTNESKIKSLGEENTNLIKASIKDSSSHIIKSLRATEENGATALGPAVLLSLSLMKNAKIGSRIFLCTDGMSNLGVGDISENKEKAIEYYTKIGNMAKDKGVVISLITFEDSESEIDVLKNMVELSGGEIIRVNPNEILDGFNDLLDNEVIASGVEIKMNLSKCLTFRDQDKKDLKNEESSLVKKLGNVTKETEDYYEFKFKHAVKLSEIKEIDFDELKNVTFQIEILYKKRNGDKVIRIITKNLKVSDNKDEINKNANFNIISTAQVRKSAKLAGKGNMMEAQAQIHVARNFLNHNRFSNKNSNQAFIQFNNNMNSFHNNLNSNNIQNNIFSNNYNFNRMNNMMMNNNNMMMNNNNMMMNNNINHTMNRYQTNNMNNDLMSGQIFSLSNTSENRQNNMFIRSNFNK